MLGDAYRAIRVKEDGSYEADGYFIIDHLHDGLCKVESYGADLSCQESRFQQVKKYTYGSYAIGDCLPNNGRSYVMMADTDMDDLLAIRKAIDRLNRLEQREWGAESQGLSVSIYVRSISGGKVRIADYTRMGRVELHSEHSTLARHFIGAANREGIHAPMEEPARMNEEMHERMGMCLKEIADKYGFQCGKEASGLWYLGIQEAARINRVFLRLKRDRTPSACIQLSDDIHGILRDFVKEHPAFSQEDAWTFADDLNGLCGSMAPPVLPQEKQGRNGQGIEIGDLFPKDLLMALPHEPEGRRVTAWDVRQALLKGRDTDLRDTLIGFLRNLDNAQNSPGAVEYLGEAASRYRLDTVREINKEKLREIAKEVLLRAGRTKRRSVMRHGMERWAIQPYFSRSETEEQSFVAEGTSVFAYDRSREMAR